MVGTARCAFAHPALPANLRALRPKFTIAGIDQRFM
jgi:hypothetical protein